MTAQPENQDLYFFSRMKSGDENAFDYFFNFYYSGLCVYAKKYLYDNHLIEEIVQSVFMKFWKDRKSISIDSSVRAYLFRSVRNKCIDVLKHRKIKEDYARSILDTGNDAVDETWETYIESELYSLLITTIDKLPPECQKVFRYSRIRHFKNKEIAEKLGISVKTVENQISKALKFLRTELKDYI